MRVKKVGGCHGDVARLEGCKRKKEREKQRKTKERETLDDIRAKAALVRDDSDRQFVRRRPADA